MNQAKHVPLFLLMLVPGVLQGQVRYHHLLVGTYTSGSSEGIYVYRLDTQTGDLVYEFTMAGVENPSFLAVSANGHYVYSVNELGGGKEGEVSAFRFDCANGKLEPINKQSSGGGAPCYLTLRRDGKYLFASNYSGGDVAVFPLNPDGSLEPAMKVMQHEGSSIHTQRQEGPHAHSVVFSPDGNFLFAGDLGTDRIYTYHYQPGRPNGPLSPAQPPYVSVEAGGGPRHLVFNAEGSLAYLVLELTGEVGVFRHGNGVLTQIQQIPLTAPGFTGQSGAAEVRISPDGQFLYASNRGEANELTIYAIDPRSGELRIAGRQSTLGKTPRNFLITPEGNFLLAANQDSDQIVLFRRDPETGQLTQTGKTIAVGNPVYLMTVPF